MATTTTEATTRESKDVHDGALLIVVVRMLLFTDIDRDRGGRCLYTGMEREEGVAGWRERGAGVREEKLKNGLYLPSIKQVLNHVKNNPRRGLLNFLSIWKALDV